MVDLMLIVPHPDDEVFGCGGLFSHMADAGKRVATLTLTRGGSGRTLGLCTREALPGVREAELRASLAALGVRDVYIDDLPDFVPDADRGIAENLGLAGVDETAGVARVTELLDALEPAVVVTFPPNGSNGHPDHIVTHRWVRGALQKASHTPDRLYYFATERPYSGEARAGFTSPEEIRALHLPPTHYVEVGPYIENKLRAMGQHETQARSVLTFMRRFPRRLLVESFHRATPDYPVGEGPRTVTWL